MRACGADPTRVQGSVRSGRSRYSLSLIDFQNHLPPAIISIVRILYHVEYALFFSRKSSANRLMSPIDFENMDKESINIATVF